jgi:hypothetical protein
MRKNANKETLSSIFFPKKSPTLHGNGGGNNSLRPGASGGSKENPLSPDNSKNLIGDGESVGTDNNAGDASKTGKSGSEAENPSGGNIGVSDSSNVGPGANQAVGNQNGANSNENSAAATTGASGALTDSAGNIIGIQIY